MMKLWLVVIILALGLAMPAQATEESPLIERECVPLCDVGFWKSMPSLAQVQAELDKGVSLEAERSVVVKGVEGIGKVGSPTPLHMAARRTTPEIIRLLIDAGADVNAVTAFAGLTPLHGAVAENSTKEEDQPENVRALIEGGANVNAQIASDSKNPDGKGITALHFAVHSVEIVKILIDAGADIHLADDVHGIQPIHFAAQGVPEVMQIFLDLGVSIETKDKDGQTPLHYATHRRHPEIVNFLLDAGADPLVQDDKGKIPFDYAKEDDRWQEHKEIYNRLKDASGR